MPLDNTQTTLHRAELFEFEMVNGLLLYLTSYGSNIEYDGKTFLAIPVQRGKINCHSNLQVDKVDISLGIVGLTIGEKLFTVPQIIRRDYLRGCHVRILRVDPTVLDDDQLLFEGWESGGLSWNAGWLTISVGSILDRLKQKAPKLIYSESCQHQVFDARCTLIPADYVESGSAGAGSTTSTIYSAVFAFSNQAEGYWTRGKISFTDGDNIYVSRTVAQHNDGHVILMLPLPEDIAEGDGFDVLPGCDGSGETCDVKYDNYDNFFGFEYIPNPDMVLW